MNKWCMVELWEIVCNLIKGQYHGLVWGVGFVWVAEKGVVAKIVVSKLPSSLFVSLT